MHHTHLLGWLLKVPYQSALLSSSIIISIGSGCLYAISSVTHKHAILGRNDNAGLSLGGLGFLSGPATIALSTTGSQLLSASCLLDGLGFVSTLLLPAGGGASMVIISILQKETGIWEVA